MILEPDAYYQVATILKPESFSDIDHKSVYLAIQALAADNMAIDMITVTSKCQQLGLNVSASKIMNLTSHVAGAGHIETHARIIKEQYIKRLIFESSVKFQQKLADPTVSMDEAIEELNETQDQINSLIHGNGVVKSFAQITPELIEEFKRRQEAHNEGKIHGVPSRIQLINVITGSYKGGSLFILAARPSMGKTAFALSEAFHIASLNIPVLFFSLEMMYKELVERYFVGYSEVNSYYMKNGTLNAQDWKKIDETVVKASQLPIYVDETSCAELSYIQNVSKIQKKKNGIQIIFVDYLQLVQVPSMRNNREQEISYISRSLKALSKQLDVPVVALSQLNRAVENRAGLEGKRPQLSDLRESGAIEQDADIVAFVHRDSYYDRDNLELKNQAEIIFRKNRGGELMDVPVWVSDNKVRWENPREEQDVSPSDLEFNESKQQLDIFQQEYNAK